jgi:uncharacterized protein YqjF (DUF2071 family)
MSVVERGGWIEFASERSGAGLKFRGRYRANGDVVPAAEGSLEQFLVERYRLYAADRRGRIYHADVVHDPWPLERAEAELHVEGSMVEVAGDPHLRFSRSVEVLIWPPRLSSLRAISR